MLDKRQVVAHFIFEEGLRLESYTDTRGYWTIGVGRLLGAGNQHAGRRISHETAMQMLDDDIDNAVRIAKRLLTDYDSHPNNVKLAVVDMAFNLGQGGLSRFVRTLSHLNARRYAEAADEALDSVWAVQVPNRARRITDLIRSAA